MVNLMHGSQTRHNKSYHLIWNIFREEILYKIVKAYNMVLKITLKYIQTAHNFKMRVNRNT